jgi:hypothetical protein
MTRSIMTIDFPAARPSTPHHFGRLPTPASGAVGCRRTPHATGARGPTCRPAVDRREGRAGLLTRQAERETVGIAKSLWALGFTGTRHFQGR